MYKVDYLSHNWLVHLLHNRVFRKYSSRIKGKVVDLGCGLQPYKQDVLDLGAEYTGVDWSSSLHHVNPDVIADLTQALPFENQSFDTILSFQVLEHLPTPQSLLEECHRILRNGGTLFLTVPFQWRVHEAPYDFFRYTRYGLEFMLKNAGFEEFRVEEVGEFWYTWILKWNYFLATKFALGPLKYLFAPFWFLNQVIALGLDRVITTKNEAGGYVVLATK